jgi:hypothetical protein
MPNLDKILAFEQGEMTEEEFVSFFQEMINDGSCWQLQGTYGRHAKNLIESGICIKGSTSESAVERLQELQD